MTLDRPKQNGAQQDGTPPATASAPCTIRPAQAMDVPTIAAFNQAMAWETEHRRLNPDTLAAGVAHLLNHPDLGFYLVAEIDGAIVGCLLITFEWSDWRNGLIWWIQSVYVSPDWRRRGVFRSLFEQVKTRAQGQHHVCGLRLYVEQDNIPAQNTYQRMGMGPTAYRMYETIWQDA
jgi:GNAT superfamily N-acetyltransferase